MYIHHRPAAALFRLAVSAVAVLGLGLQFATLGDAAWRLFSTWAMLIAAIYFAVLALFSAFVTRRSLGKENSPMLGGALATSGAIIFVGTICLLCYNQPVWGIGGFGSFIVHFLLPILILLDYILFCRKGRFQIIYPLDWLVLPVIYIALILLSALNHVTILELALPYVFLNYNVIGFESFALFLIIFAVLILAFGYGLFLVDFALSGKLAKKIVMPKLKAVVIEDERTGAADRVGTAVETVIGKTTKTPKAEKTNKEDMAQEANPKTNDVTKKSSSASSTASKKPAKTSSRSTDGFTGRKMPKKSTQKTSSAKQAVSSSGTKTSSNDANKNSKQNLAPKAAANSGSKPVRPQVGVKNRPEVKVEKETKSEEKKDAEKVAAEKMTERVEKIAENEKMAPSDKGTKQSSPKTSGKPKIRKF